MDHDLKSLHAKARLIAAAMEPGWAYDVNGSKNADGVLHWSARIALTGQQHAFYISRKGYGADKGRLLIRADLPTRTAAGEHVPYDGALNSGERTPTIACNGERPAKALASEISRRLLPKLDAALKVQLQRLASYNAHETARATLADKLLAADIGASKPSGRKDASIYLSFPDGSDAYGDVRVNGSTCKLEISGLTAEQAIAMIKIARGEV